MTTGLGAELGCSRCRCYRGALLSFNVEPGALHGELPRLSIADWVFAAWTAGIAAAVILVEAAIALWWERAGFGPGEFGAGVFVLMFGVGLYLAGLVVFWILGVLGTWLFGTAQGLAHWVRSSRP